MYLKYILTANDGKPVAEKCVWFYIYVSVSGHVCDFVFIQYVGYVCMTIHECRQERRTGGQVQPGLESFITSSVLQNNPLQQREEKRASPCPHV